MLITWYLIIWQEENKRSKAIRVLALAWIHFKAQESILNPPLFNLFLIDLFLFVEEAHTMSYADDNASSMCSENYDVTLNKTRGKWKNLFLNDFQTKP